jgi:hypothetical protein
MSVHTFEMQPHEIARHIAGQVFLADMQFHNFQYTGHHVQP